MSHYSFGSLLGLASILFIPTQVAAFEYGDPSPYEQLQLEAFNRVRADPLSVANRLKIDLNNGLAPDSINSQTKQPLSFNVELLQLTQRHSQDMLARQYLSDTTPEGLSFGNQLQNSAYPYLSATEITGQAGNNLTSDIIQNVLSFPEDLYRSENDALKSYRLSILNPDYREIGLGIAIDVFAKEPSRFKTMLYTSIFATRIDAHPIILGVAYEDRNHNQKYDLNEGLAGVNVSISTDQATQTASAGGFGLEVKANNVYNLTFNHPKFGTITKTVIVDQDNVKVNVISDEFKQASAEQCATLDAEMLNIPCIQAGNQIYTVQLSAVNFSPLQFGIQYIANQNLNLLAKCDNFDAQTQIANLKCLQVGNQRYWAKLNLTTNNANTPAFEVQSYGEVPQNSIPSETLP